MFVFYGASYTLQVILKHKGKSYSGQLFPVTSSVYR